MGVRVEAKLANPKSGKSLNTSLLLNAAYEAPYPSVVLPKKLAQVLEFTSTGSVHVKSIAGISSLQDAGSIQVEVHGRSLEARARISEHEDEAIASDLVIELLGIELVKPATNVYRLSGESQLRAGVEPRRW